MIKVLRAGAAIETATGVGLLLAPRLVVRILLRAELTGSGVAVSRVCGLALLCLGLACWPSSSASPGGTNQRAARALLVYNGSATIYFLYLRIVAGYGGIALEIVIAVHAVLTALLAWRRST